MSFSEYARTRGYSQARVSQAVKEGKLTAYKDDKGRPYLDPVQADREWRERTDPSKQGAAKPKPDPPRSSAPPESEPNRGSTNQSPEGHEPQEPSFVDDLGTPKYDVSRARREHTRSKMDEAKYRVFIGSLVESEAVKRQAFELGRALREAMLSIPDRLAAELAAETDQHKVHQRLTKELVIAMQSVAGKAPDETLQAVSA